jgi:hypothetical protein
MIVGFMGQKHSGKDTVCDFLSCGMGYTKIAFATPLKNSIKELFGFTEEQLHTVNKDKIDINWGIKPRDALQFIGTDMIRDLFPKLIPNIGEDFLVKRANIWVENNSDIKNIAFSDVRFQNEVDYIHSLGGVVIKIYRPNSTYDSHISESGINEIDNFDYKINNNSTIDDLYKNVEEVIRKVREDRKKKFD